MKLRWVYTDNGERLPVATTFKWHGKDHYILQVFNESTQQWEDVQIEEDPECRTDHAP